MISKQFLRLLHLSTARDAVGASKSNLAKLRKKTGYPFGNCKKALEASNNDLGKAEKWLEDQARALGWSKAMKMENRSTSQGLVGVAWDKQHAAMVELNCETDFVGRNEKFQKLVDLVAKTCLQHTKSENLSPSQVSKVMLEGPEVGKLLAADHQSLEDHVVRAVALVGERLVLRRAAVVSVQAPMCLAALAHPSTTGPQMGKYGAVLLYTTKSAHERTTQLAKQLCQHVIGMNPSTVNAPPDAEAPPPPPVIREPTQDIDKSAESATDAGEEEETMQVDSFCNNETAMMRQVFLLDAERTVADVVNEAGIEVHDYVRFECGERLNESEEESAKVAQAGG